MLRCTYIPMFNWEVQQSTYRVISTRMERASTMKVLISVVILISFIALSSCDSQQGNKTTKPQRTQDEKNQFKSWRKQFGKQYKSQNESDDAMEKLLANKAQIDAHNKLYDEGKVTYKRGLWAHSDWSNEDKEKNLLGIKLPTQTRSAPVLPRIPQYPPAPASVDWRNEGLVGPVEDQGSCGSCWAFSAAGVIEGVLRRKNITDSVSPQQLVDCSNNSCWGCSSGWPYYALQYVAANGIADVQEYPYVGFDQTCDYAQNMSVGHINQTYDIPTAGKIGYLHN